MRDLLRILVVVLLFTSTARSSADEIRWSFDELPPNSLVGDAALLPIGPSADYYEGLPRHNSALRLDGNGDYVRVVDEGDDSPLDFDHGDPITIESWVQLNQVGEGQNVYIVGKGRTHLDGAKDNQNYALRLRSVGGDARISFLFRSKASDEQPSDWHRWTSKRGFRADGSWHHVAVTYRFGDSKSVRGYLDGKSVDGSWDMGGATERPPVVDNDELWIGSALGGGSGNSLCGAIDEVVIDRRIAVDAEFADRRIVITHPPTPPSEGLPRNSVSVSLHENIGSEGTWPIASSTPLIRYQQTAFAIPRIPVPYADGGIRRDWTGPVMITAMAELKLPAGRTEWMLRGGGLSRLWIGDQVVVETPVHLGASSGHGEVTRYEQPDPWLRPPRAGHHEETATYVLEDSGATLVTLQTIIGGKDLRYEPGEILVAYRVGPADSWQILTVAGGVPLTDADWPPLANQVDMQIQQVDDQQRRIAASSQDSHWEMRHQRARQYVNSLPELELPASISSIPASSEVDRFINARIASVGKVDDVSALAGDSQFIRRIYLDCVGVIPSIAEIKAFETMPGDNRQRRAALIDRVLQDPRWADHWTAYWMDVLAENPNVLKPSLNNSGPFRWYLYDVLRDNVAVDRWVTGLVRMKGSTRHGGPAGFAMASQNDVPMAAKAHVLTSAFLGANMKCARCHDAPYHDWTQRDLFSIAAMLGRKPITVPTTSSVPGDFFAGESPGESLISLSIKPGEAVDADWPLAKYTSDVSLDASLLAQSDDSREQLAAYLTRPENQQFARTIVNRLWQRWLGEGLVDPIEDWEGADASHPMLLDFLARQLTANDYDLKHVARLILNSQTYQRAATDRPVTRDESERLFTSPRLRRMTAEQVVDSMHVAVGRTMDAGELTFDPEARMKPAAQGNLGQPRRAWQLTSLSNERDRPALSLPKASAVTECLKAFGWSGARQDPINHRQSEANVVQPGILASGMLSIQLTRLVDGDAVTSDCLKASAPAELVDDLFQRFLTRGPTEVERERFTALLSDGFDSRVLGTPTPAETPIREPGVSWANHLHPEATEVRLRESDRLRMGPPPSRWLREPWRERAEDAVWALVNTPEFLFLP
jgi:hypothetical protein